MPFDWVGWQASVDRQLADITTRVRALETNAKLDDALKQLGLIASKVDKQLFTPDDLAALDRMRVKLNLVDPIR